MTTATQYNPNTNLNELLFDAGVSKTVYALVTPETEAAKAAVFGDDGTIVRNEYLEQFRDAWTAKQDRYHEEFFDTWCEWSKPVVDLDRDFFPFFYPTAGASEPLRHLIYDYAIRANTNNFEPVVRVFEGEYEGYKAMAEAAGVRVIEHKRDDWQFVSQILGRNDMFLISQPSAIDGNVWHHFNEFLRDISEVDAGWSIPARVIVDLTYVGAVSHTAIPERFNMNEQCVRNVVFSLSKPFGCYYDRIGGVFCRKQDLGLFGNKWFKNLTGLRLGTILMQNHGVFYMANNYESRQVLAAEMAGLKLGIELVPSDVFLLATGPSGDDTPMANYLRRAGRQRLCLTPAMATMIGTSGEIA
jgi:hypothetical protein